MVSRISLRGLGVDLPRTRVEDGKPNGEGVLPRGDQLVQGLFHGWANSLIDPNEVLVIPRLSALARLHDFHSEVERAETFE